MSRRGVITDRCLSSAHSKSPPRKAGSQEVEAIRVLGTAPLGHPQWFQVQVA